MTGLTRRTFVGRGSAAAAVVLGAGPAADAVARSGAVRRRRRARGRVVEVLGTELEYYRSDPAHLEGRLALCQAAGYNTIQTYVPWNVHENTRGKLDFTGKTHPVIVGDHADEYQIETPDQEVAAGGYESRVVANTDLIGFIKACERHGFKVILRPGPFLSDEWRNGGLPDWLATAYPNMFMRGPHNTTLEPGFPFSPPLASVIGGGPLYYFSGPSYASPDYIRETKRWLTAFANAVRPMLATAGGPIVSMQVDDEICFYYRFGPFEVDYHPSMVARFGQTPPTDWPATGGPVTALRPALDWQRFKAGQLAVWLGTCAEALRAGGADVPITHEEEFQLAPPANFARLAAVLDTLHPEFYLDPGAYTVPTIELCAAAMRACQRHRRDTYSCEMSGGDVLVRHLLTGEGITGFLGFTYTTGISESDVPSISVFDQAVRLAGPRLAHSRRVADVAIVWPPEHMYAPYDSTQYGFERDVRGAIESDIPALAELLVRAGYAFDLLDTDVAQPSDYDAYRSIWLVCADVLPRSCQRALVRYVRRGGHLICWPAAPTLDEDYAPCTVLRDALYAESLGPSYPADNQTVTVLGRSIEVFRGVQTFRLSGRASSIAHRGAEACGYTRPSGRGRATLLGTWPACDSVAGREGDALEVQDVPAGSGASAGALALDAVTRIWGPVAAGQVNATPPPQAGTPQKMIVFDYSNERRGGEVITGGTIAYWDGVNVAPVAEITLANQTPVVGSSNPQVSRPPFRPITPAHLAVARALHGHRPLCDVSDLRAQARILQARGSTAATVSVVNRYDDDIAVALTVRHRGRNVRLPSRGKLTVPAGVGLLLPLDYDLGHGVHVVRASAQLLGASVRRGTLQLSTLSYGGGEVVLRLAGRRKLVRVAVPSGQHQLSVKL